MNEVLLLMKRRLDVSTSCHMTYLLYSPVLCFLGVSVMSCGDENVNLGDSRSVSRWEARGLASLFINVHRSSFSYATQQNVP